MIDTFTFTITPNPTRYFKNNTEFEGGKDDYGLDFEDETTYSESELQENIASENMVGLFDEEAESDMDDLFSGGNNIKKQFDARLIEDDMDDLFTIDM